MRGRKQAGPEKGREGSQSVGSTGLLSASSGGFRGNFQGLNCFLHAPHLLAGARTPTLCGLEMRAWGRGGDRFVKLEEI